MTFLTLRGVEIDGANSRVMKFTFALRYEGQTWIVVARSLRRATRLIDLQRLGPLADIEWPSEIIEAVSDRVHEEMARIEYVRQAA